MMKNKTLLAMLFLSNSIYCVEPVVGFDEYAEIAIIEASYLFCASKEIPLYSFHKGRVMELSLVETAVAIISDYLPNDSFGISYGYCTLCNTASSNEGYYAFGSDKDLIDRIQDFKDRIVLCTSGATEQSGCLLYDYRLAQEYVKNKNWVLGVSPYTILDGFISSEQLKGSWLKISDPTLPEAYSSELCAFDCLGLVVENGIMTIANQGNTKAIVVRDLSSDGSIPVFSTARVNAEAAVVKTDLLSKGEHSAYMKTTFALEHGDFIVLGTDGLWNTITDDEVHQQIVSSILSWNDLFEQDVKEPDTHDFCVDIAQKLSILARIKGSNDDISCVVLYYEYSPIIEFFSPTL